MPLLIILGALIIYLLIRIYEADAESKANMLAMIILITVFIAILVGLVFLAQTFPIVSLILIATASVIVLIVFMVSSFKQSNIEQSNVNKEKSNQPVQEPSDNSNNDTIIDSSTTPIESSIDKPTEIPVSSPTTFQDELKKTFRTQEEISETEKTKKQQHALFEAQKILGEIRQKLLHQSNNGLYVTKDGKKYVTCVIMLPFEYMQKKTTNQKKVLQEQLNRMMIGNSPSRNSQLIKQYHPIIRSAPGRETTFSISPEHRYEYEFFIKELQTMAANDGIIVKPIIYNNSTHSEYSIPHVVKDTDCEGFLFSLGDSKEENCSLAAKCYCEIPDKYSSDNPLASQAINTIDNTNEVIKNVETSIDTMDGHAFESFCADLLRQNGFSDVVVTQGSGDQGIDIIAYKDDIKYGIQCKCYHSDIGNKAIQEAYSGKAFYGCHIGVVLTNRYFTRSAIELAKNNGILLWDRSKLQSFMNHGKGKV